MQVIPLAADSMGVRSLATYVETRDVRLLIDPGASLAESRFGLPPHPLEAACLDRIRRRIALYVKSADAVVLTQYNPGHFCPELAAWLRGKTLLVKNPNLNLRSERRAMAFGLLQDVRADAKGVSFADGETFAFRNTRVVFGHAADPQVPAPASPNASVPLAVSDGHEAFAATSCCRGAPSRAAAAFLTAQRPSLLYLDGPDTLPEEGSGHGPSPAQAFKGLKALILDSGARNVIYDHHPMRDPNWRPRAEPLYRFALEHGVTIRTAAEYRGEENLELESQRRHLHASRPAGGTAR